MTDSKHSKSTDVPQSSSPNEASSSEASASAEGRSNEDSNGISRLPVRTHARKQGIRPFNAPKPQTPNGEDSQLKATPQEKQKPAGTQPAKTASSTVPKVVGKKEVPDDLKRMALRSPFADQEVSTELKSDTQSVSSGKKIASKTLTDEEASSVDEILASGVNDIFSPDDDDEMDPAFFDFPEDPGSPSSANPSFSPFAQSSPRNLSKPAGLVLPFGKNNARNLSKPENSLLPPPPPTGYIDAESIQCKQSSAFWQSFFEEFIEPSKSAFSTGEYDACPLQCKQPGAF